MSLDVASLKSPGSVPFRFRVHKAAAADFGRKKRAREVLEMIR